MASNIFQDILCSADDLLINVNTGDFQIGASDQQHIEDIIVAFPGEWKQYPQVGVGIRAYFGSAGKEQEASRSIRLQLQADGYLVRNPNVEQTSAGKMTVSPNAVRQ